MIDARTLSRRSFMRRMLGAGVGLLSLEFIGGSLAFLWPPATEGVGVEYPVGTLADLNVNFPSLGARRARRVPPGTRLPRQRPRGNGLGVR